MKYPFLGKIQHLCLKDVFAHLHRERGMKMKMTGDLEEHLSDLQHICKGYLVTATTVTNCLHSCKLFPVRNQFFFIESGFKPFTSVCKSCLVKQMVDKNNSIFHCPTCRGPIEGLNGLRYWILHILSKYQTPPTQGGPPAAGNCEPGGARTGGQGRAEEEDILWGAFWGGDRSKRVRWHIWLFMIFGRCVEGRRKWGSANS